MDRRLSDHVRGGVGAALATGGLLWGIVLGLAVHGRTDGEAQRSLFVLAPSTAPPPEKPTPVATRSRAVSGRAAPPQLWSRATEVTAPRPAIPLPVPLAIPLAEKAAAGREATSGSAPVAGPGTGAGGLGDGLGAGGDGEGAGAGDGDHVPPRLIRGRIRDSDYPDDLADAGVGGRVGVRYVVGIDGRVEGCDVIASSGIQRLDSLTCRLIRKRFRFRPSRDGAGRAVRATIEENHEWLFEMLPPER